MADARLQQSAPTSADLALLRRFEPVLRFTRGEQFFPTFVDDYVAACSLWLHHPDGRDELLVERNELTLANLATPRPAPFGAVHYLKLIEPLTIAELTAYLIESRRNRRSDGFRPDLGRLARVGYGSRLLDAIFSLTLLLRGRVPGDTAAAAAILARQWRERDPRQCYVYYGRVVREGDWIALQYWYFYLFNDWRSRFYGANDHEADWEMVTIYLYQRPDGEPVPEWVAYASHDYHGDDLRRRWDDRGELELVGEHPVVYVGAGSHASYFRRGEYLTEIEIAHITPLVRVVDRIRAFWVRTLRQAGADARLTPLNIFTIPFVDYARGDGLTIGDVPGRTWTPVLLEPVPDWVRGYRGLWGLYARDPLSGENAPSGPMYNRDGTVRRSWYDPVGWAGLDKVAPPPAELSLLQGRRERLGRRQAELADEINRQAATLRELGAELATMQGHPHLATRHAQTATRLRTLAAEVGALRREREQNAALIEALDQRIDRLAAGRRDDPRAHLHRKATPASEARLRLSRLLEFWAAVSISLVLLCLLVLFVSAREYLAPGLAALLGAFLFIEAVFRRRIANLITTVTVALAIVSAIVLVREFFWQILEVTVLAAGLYLLWENLSEVRR